MSHSFIQQDDVQKLLREGAGLNGPEGNERLNRLFTACSVIFVPLLMIIMSRRKNSGMR